MANIGNPDDSLVSEPAVEELIQIGQIETEVTPIRDIIVEEVEEIEGLNNQNQDDSLVSEPMVDEKDDIQEQIPKELRIRIKSLQFSHNVVNYQTSEERGRSQSRNLESQQSEQTLINDNSQKQGPIERLRENRSLSPDIFANGERDSFFIMLSYDG